MGKKISVTRKHTLGLEGATAKLNDLTGQLAEKYGVKAKIEGNNATFKGTGVEGDLKLTADSVTINLELGFLMGPMAGQIEEGVVRQLDKHFA